MFWWFGKNAYLCPRQPVRQSHIRRARPKHYDMAVDKFIITGRNTLTGFRDQISRAMTEVEADARLERERENRKYQKHPAYTHLRKERLEAVQLTIQFN